MTYRVEVEPAARRALRKVTGAMRGRIEGAILLLAMPRMWAYSGLVTQNLELKTQLQDVESRMDEADRILSRLRLYDAQLRSLTTAKGGTSTPASRAALHRRVLSTLVR